MGQFQQNRDQHQSSPMGRRHEERPSGQIDKSDPHSDPPGMASANQFGEAEPDQHRRQYPFENV